MSRLYARTGNSFIARLKRVCLRHLAEEMSCTEQADEADHNQVQGNDEIQQTRHQQNQDTGDQGE